MSEKAFSHPLGRRDLLKAAALAAASGSVLARPSTAAASVTANAIVHPGMLHTQTDLDRMAAQVGAGAQPWTAGWNVLTANSHSASTWTPDSASIVYRGSGYPENYGQLYNDVAAAYQNALRWHISGDTAHAT